MRRAEANDTSSSASISTVEDPTLLALLKNPLQCIHQEHLANPILRDGQSADHVTLTSPAP